jgi:hypothetical protein
VVRDDYLVLVPPELAYDGAAVVVYRVTEDGFEDLGTVSLVFWSSCRSLLLMGEDPDIRDAPPSTGLRAGFDTLLRCASQLLRMRS